MKTHTIITPLVTGLLAALASCRVVAPEPTAEERVFTPVQTVLETNCVHCHGDARLSMMPPLTGSRSLAKLIGPQNWIVPSKPERSRFFQVVAFPDEMPGAMPPTGHAVRSDELRILRIWIESGAAVPARAAITFKPKGKAPRSR